MLQRKPILDAANAPAFVGGTKRKCVGQGSCTFSKRCWRVKCDASTNNINVMGRSWFLVEPIIFFGLRFIAHSNVTFNAATFVLSTQWHNNCMDFLLISLVHQRGDNTKKMNVHAFIVECCCTQGFGGCQTNMWVVLAQQSCWFVCSACTRLPGVNVSGVKRWLL